MKRRRRVAACLVAGVLMLAISASAAFGSVNGYARYKQAVKDLLLTEDNFTAQAKGWLSVDGEALGSVQMDYAKDGANNARSTQEQAGGTVYREYRTVLDGVCTYFSENSKVYSTYPVEDRDLLFMLLGSSVDPEMEDRIVDFAEDAVDLVVGELKNNVVQLGTEEGEDLYQVRVSRSQIPSLLNAGLSALVYYDVGEPVQRYVAYEESYTTFLLSRFEAVTGETLSQEFKDRYCQGDYDGAWQKSHQDLITRIEAFSSTEWNREVVTRTEQKEAGVLYVKNDGSYVDYDTVSEFLADFPQRRQEYLDFYLGGDIALEDVVCTFRIDEEGKLTANQFQINLKTIDSAGGYHTMQMAVDGTFTNFGTTTVAPLDVGDRVEQT